MSMTLPNQLPTITSNGGGDTALIAFYSFDETSGPIAHDQQGEHDGTNIGATHVPGVTGNALQFNCQRTRFSRMEFGERRLHH
jgi:hypothetical protein